jgi:hypothetical protein
MSGPNKGPQGPKEIPEGDDALLGCQEEYETDMHHVGVTDIPSLEPFELKAPESDHTPNHTKGPKPSKSGYGKFSTGEVGL